MAIISAKCSLVMHVSQIRLSNCNVGVPMSGAGPFRPHAARPSRRGWTRMPQADLHAHFLPCLFAANNPGICFLKHGE